MTGAWPVFIREMMILQKRYRKMLLSMAVSPLLFMIAFGWGLGRGISMEGVDYLSFLTPGLMAMASMNRSFAISSEINIARFYWHIFEEFQAAPISNFSIVLGETAAGCVRGLIGALVVYLLALFFGVKINAGPLLWIMILLNCLVFSSVAVCTAMVVKSHADQSMLNSFIITPMAFLCGTFFSLSALPGWASTIVSILPLTHTTKLIRAAALDQSIEPFSIMLSISFTLLFFGLAIKAVSLTKT